MTTARSVVLVGVNRQDAYDEAQRIIPTVAVVRRYPYAWLLAGNPEHTVHLATLTNLAALRGLRFDYLRLTPQAMDVVDVERLRAMFVGRRRP